MLFYFFSNLSQQGSSFGSFAGWVPCLVTSPKPVVSEKRIFLKWSESPIYDGYYAEFSKNPCTSSYSWYSMGPKYAFTLFSE